MADTRSVVTSIAGLFGGPAVAAITVLMSGTFRIWQGGVGAFTGVLVAVASAGLGVAYHYLRNRRPEAIKPLYLYGFGVMVHVAMLLCILTLPWPLAWEVLKKISLPVMVIFPAVSLLLAMLLADQESRIATVRALQESEERFRSTVENTDAGYFFIDTNGLIQDVTHAWVKMYKYHSAGEMLGQHFTVIQRAEDLEAAKKFVSGIMAGDTRYLAGEFSRKCADDSIGFHTFSARPAVKSGEVVGIEGFIIDITEHKQSERALAESEEKFRNLAEQSLAGFYLIRNDIFIYVNQKFAEIFGYSVEECRDNMRFATLVHPDDLATVEEQVGKRV